MAMPFRALQRDSRYSLDTIDSRNISHLYLGSADCGGRVPGVIGLGGRCPHSDATAVSRGNQCFYFEFYSVTPLLISTVRVSYHARDDFQ
jgi:hypothetical protein